MTLRDKVQALKVPDLALAALLAKLLGQRRRRQKVRFDEDLSEGEKSTLVAIRQRAREVYDLDTYLFAIRYVGREQQTN